MSGPELQVLTPSPRLSPHGNDSKALAALLDESTLPLINTLEMIQRGLKRRGEHLAKTNERLEARLGPKQRAKFEALCVEDAHAPVRRELEGEWANGNRLTVLKSAATGTVVQELGAPPGEEGVWCIGRPDVSVMAGRMGELLWLRSRS